MAGEDKKGKPKEKPAGWDFGVVEGIVLLLFLLSILGSFLPTLIRYVTSGEISFYGYSFGGFFDFFKSNSFFFKFLGLTLASGAAVATLILTKKGDAIWREEIAKLYPENMPDLQKTAGNEKSMTQIDERWQSILTHSESTTPSDWRFAIIEADILLDELLDQLRLPSNTIGDKLKAVEPSDFLTLDSAWEAHKARNQIAHQGSNFLLNQHETRRIIALYASVFKEFGLI